MSTNPTKSSTAAYNYKFVGWSPVVDSVIADTKYLALYDSSKVKYTVTFMNGLKEFEIQVVEYGEAAIRPSQNPVRDGYKFMGWSPSFEKISTDLIVNAMFRKIIECAVDIYDADGNALNNWFIQKDELYELPEAPKKDGYKFIGWYDSKGNFLGNPGDVITITDNISIVPHYEEIPVPSSSSVVSSSSAKPVSSSSEKLSSSSEAKSSSSVKVESSSSKEVSSSSQEPASSSSEKLSSSSEAKSSSSVKVESSSSVKPEGLIFAGTMPQFKVVVIGKKLQISGATIGKNFAIFDMQGAVIRKSKVTASNFEIELTHAGNYIVRIGNEIQTVKLK